VTKRPKILDGKGSRGVGGERLANGLPRYHRIWKSNGGKGQQGCGRRVLTWILPKSHAGVLISTGGGDREANQKEGSQWKGLGKKSSKAARVVMVRAAE